MTATENLLWNSDTLRSFTGFGINREPKETWRVPIAQFDKVSTNSEMFGHESFKSNSHKSHSETPQYKWVGVVAQQTRPLSSPLTAAGVDKKIISESFADQIISNRLFALDNAVTQQTRSFSPPVFDTFYPRRSPPHQDDMEGSRGTPSPVSQSLLKVAKRESSWFYSSRILFNLINSKCLQSGAWYFRALFSTVSS